MPFTKLAHDLEQAGEVHTLGLRQLSPRGVSKRAPRGPEKSPLCRESRRVRKSASTCEPQMAHLPCTLQDEQQELKWRPRMLPATPENKLLKTDFENCYPGLFLPHVIQPTR